MPAYQLKNAVKAAQFRVKFKDIFNMKQLYTDIRYYLLENGWSSVDMEGKLENKDNWETMYLERGLPDGGVERWTFWRTIKEPTKYFRWHLDVDMHNVALYPTEVMRDGKKLKANKGEFEVKVWAYLEYEASGNWEKNPILKHFKKIFAKSIMKQDIFSDHKLELYREAYNILSYVKRWMKLKRFLPYEEIGLFHPSQSYPTWKKE